MERYEKYKPSRVTWLPEIPAHWEMSQAKYYFQYTTGFTPPTGAVEFYNGDITWVTIADMNQKVVFDSTTKLSQTAIDKYNPDLTLKDSLLYSFKLSVGKVAYAGKDLFTNEAIISIMPNEKYDLRYFYFTLPEQLLQSASENIYGAKMLNQELIRNAAICFPPKEEQTAVADYLDKKTSHIDTLIANKQTLIELLKEERTAIINQAVTKGINSKAKLKPSGIEWLGDIPEHWGVKKLKYVADVVLGKMLTNEDKGGYHLKSYLRAANLQRLNVDVSDVKEMWFTTNELSKLRLKKYDLLVSEGGEVGRTCIWNEELDECYIQNSVHKITMLHPNEPKYFLYLFYSYGQRGFFDSIVNRISIAHLTGDKIKEILIIMPPAEEQSDINHYIESHTARINATISKIEKEIELLQEYRTALISEVVTGKIKVI